MTRNVAFLFPEIGMNSLRSLPEALTFACLALGSMILCSTMAKAQGMAKVEERPRAREAGVVVGILRPGPWNAITDVEGVKVGHSTLVQGGAVRTGVTVILPHSGNIFQEKVPAAVHVGNGFGKLTGSTQIEELGNLETPIVLTNTLSVPAAAQAVIEYVLKQKGNEDVRSVNPVVGETNDGWLNDIRGQHVKQEHVWAAIDNATSGPVEEGSVGAGTGTQCLGFKGGIGTASRTLPKSQGGYTVGVLVQTNFGGILEINGAPVGRELGRFAFQEELSGEEPGSCMIIVATNAPLSSRNLKRLASRAVLGLAKTGSFMANGSGDYVIAFSTHPSLRVPFHPKQKVRLVEELHDEFTSMLFLAVVEATQEAVYNSLFKATTVTGREGHRSEAIPIVKVLEICSKYGVLHWDRTLLPASKR